jgi:tetratricopeptide (TPR) repeat protein
MTNRFLKSIYLVRSAVFFSLLTCIGLCFPANSRAQEKPLDWYQIERGLLTKGVTPETATFEARLGFIIEAVRRRGVSFEMTAYREGFLRNSGSNDDLIATIKQAKKITPTAPSASSPEYFFLRGNACLERDSSCKLTNYTQAIQLNPKYVDAYNNRALVFSKLGNIKNALLDFETAIEITPNYSLLYVNRGSIYQDNEKHREAIEDFNRAIEINPSFAVAFYNRGVSEARLGNTKQALADYNQAIELNRKYADAYLNRGAIYGDSGKHDLAIKDFTSVIQLNPKDIDAYRNRGIIYERNGEMEKANSDYRKAESLKNLAGGN